MNFNQQKCALVETLLPLCPFVAVDATQPGVVVPGGLNRADLVLRVGRDPRVMPKEGLEKRHHPQTPEQFGRGQHDAAAKRPCGALKPKSSADWALESGYLRAQFPRRDFGYPVSVTAGERTGP